MAAKSKIQVEELNYFKKSIRRASATGNNIETHAVWVVAIHRYLGDPKHCAQVGVTSSQMLDVFQLTIADDAHKMKVVLAPELNYLVQQCKLQAGHVVCIKKSHVHYDETDLSGSSVLIVDQIEILGFRQLKDTKELTSLRWCDDCSHLEQMDIPMTTSRGYYVSVWSTMEMYGNIWNTDVSVVAGLVNTTMQDIYCIKDLARKWSNVKVTNPVLLVKVLLKSRMIHYAKPSKNDKWPFQAHLLIGDKTGVCTAVLWNAMCPDFYYRIKEGTVLLLKKFTVKKSFQVLPRFKPALGNTQLYEIDINLNSHHPASEVTILDAAHLPDTVELPPLPYNFVNRKQAGCLPNNYICDITGVVTYVGRYEREPMNNKFGVDSGGFWIRRWIHLIDDSSPRPFHLQLYKMAEGIVDINIHQGIRLVCSHVRLVQNLEHLTGSRADRLVFLTTTAESQVSVLDETLYKELKTHSAVESLWKWSISPQCKSHLSETRVGGYVCFPLLPNTAEALKATLKDSQVVPSGDWERVFTGLSFRECRQILVQATMVFIKLNVEHCDRHWTTGSPSKKSRPSNLEVTVDADVYQNQQSLTCVGHQQLHAELSSHQEITTDQWPAVKLCMQFPATELQAGQQPVPDSEKQFVKKPYFFITWSGLNSPVLLHSHLPLDQAVTDKPSMMGIFSGTAMSRDGSEDGPVFDRLQHAMSTVAQCKDVRFLVVLDCYQCSPEYTEIMVNRAIPVTS